MGQTVTTELLAKTMGLVPRYVRERQVAKAPAMARSPAPSPAPIVYEASTAAACDAITAELRSRIAGASAKPSRRMNFKIAAPAFAAALLVLGVLLNH